MSSSDSCPFPCCNVAQRSLACDFASTRGGGDVRAHDMGAVGLGKGKGRMGKGDGNSWERAWHGCPDGRVREQQWSLVHDAREAESSDESGYWYRYWYGSGAGSSTSDERKPETATTRSDDHWLAKQRAAERAAADDGYTRVADSRFWATRARRPQTTAHAKTDDMATPMLTRGDHDAPVDPAKPTDREDDARESSDGGESWVCVKCEQI